MPGEQEAWERLEESLIPPADEGRMVTDEPEDVAVEKETGKDSSSVVVQRKYIPKRILLGSGTAGGRDVYWEFGHPDLPNRHILLFGASGTGKPTPFKL